MESRRVERGAEEEPAPSQESEIDVAGACDVVAGEMLGQGLHHREVAEKYDVPVEAVTWLMKERGILFARRDQGEPPEDVLELLQRLNH